MATHSSVLAWKILGMGSHGVGHDWSDLAAAAAAVNRYNFSGFMIDGNRSRKHFQLGTVGLYDHGKCYWVNVIKTILISPNIA